MQTERTISELPALLVPSSPELLAPQRKIIGILNQTREFDVHEIEAKMNAATREKRERRDEEVDELCT